MSRQEFSVAYDGLDRHDDHSIDVELLAPALMAFGKLIREANIEFNGKKSTSKVFVVSDFEHKCFNINFEVVLTLFEQVKLLIGTQDARDAKEILEWLGIFAAGSAGTVSFLKFLQWRKGRKIESVTEVNDQSSGGTVNVTLVGDYGSITIDKNILNLSENPKALAATRDALSPVGQEGFEGMEFRNGSGTFDKIDTASADAIISSCNIGIDEAKETEPDIEITTAWLTVYSPVYEADADRWRFRLGKEIIYADISDTKIAEDALVRGGSFTDDCYQVRLEITTPVGNDGKKKKPSYKIVQVLRFIHAEPTSQMNFNNDLSQPDGE